MLVKGVPDKFSPTLTRWIVLEKNTKYVFAFIGHLSALIFYWMLLKYLLMQDKNMFIVRDQLHSCWWPEDVISIHGIVFRDILVLAPEDLTAFELLLIRT